MEGTNNMWKILAAVICTVMTEGVYAAEIAQLQACKVSDIKAAVVEQDKAPAKIARAGYQNQFCYIWNNDGGRCNATPGCMWTPPVNDSYCAGRPGMPDMQTQFCYINNNRPDNCNNTPFCRYVTSVTPGSCDPRPAPPPNNGGQPNNTYCYIWNNDGGRCNSTPG